MEADRLRAWLMLGLLGLVVWLVSWSVWMMADSAALVPLVPAAACLWLLIDLRSDSG